MRRIKYILFQIWLELDDLIYRLKDVFRKRSKR